MAKPGKWIFWLQELLDLAQLEAGELKTESLPVNLNEQLSKVKERFLPMLLEKQIQLEIIGEKSEVYAIADPVRLEQVMNNLVSNAVRHSPANSVIKLKLAKDTACARISVIDHGEGISAEDLPHIWERFYRAEKSRSRSGGGSGIGLAITQKLVAAMGGEITVESCLGRGTTFSFTLLLADGQ